MFSLYFNLYTDFIAQGEFPILIIYYLQKVSVRTPARLFAFLTPLAIEIWVYMAGAYILVSITMWIAARFSPKEWKEIETCDECLHKKYVHLHGDNCEHISDKGTSGIGSETGEQDLNEDVNDDEIGFVDDANVEHDDGQLYYEEKSLDVLENGFSIGNSFWFTIGSLMQQGSDLNPKVYYSFERF